MNVVGDEIYNRKETGGPKFSDRDEGFVREERREPREDEEAEQGVINWSAVNTRLRVKSEANHPKEHAQQPGSLSGGN